MPEHVQELADSISSSRLLHPIALDCKYVLIAGLHRLEAAKLLGWTEIECTVNDFDDMQAELAEIDENFIRKDLSGIEYSELLLRRKEVYESIHPETKQGMRNGQTSKNDKMTFLEAKSFTEDTAAKRGVSKRTIERQVQTAKRLSPEAKDIIKVSGVHITKKGAMKLSRLQPEQQAEAATLLASGEIHSIDEYASKNAPKNEPTLQKEQQETSDLPFHAEGKGKCFDSFEESLADIKNPDKDCSATPDTFLSEMTYLFHNFLKGIQWYDQDYYKAVFPKLDSLQIKYLHEQVESVCSAVKYLYNIVERTQKQ